MSPENDRFIATFIAIMGSEYEGRSEVEEILRSGFKGDVFAFAGPTVYGKKTEMSGYYIKLSNIEDSADMNPKWPLLGDRRLHSLIRERNDVPFFVRSRSRVWAMVPIYSEDDFRTQMSHCPLDRETSGPFVVLTPDTDYYVLQHELVHYDDVKSGLADQFRERMKLLENTLSPKDIQNLDAFIFEHRAFHVSQELLAKDIQAGFKFPTFKELNGALVNQNVRLPNMRSLVDGFVKYIRPTIETLRVSDKKTYETVVSILKTYCPQDGEVGLKQVLPEIF